MRPVSTLVVCLNVCAVRYASPIDNSDRFNLIPHPKGSGVLM
jgi:hypothetical protein